MSKITTPYTILCYGDSNTWGYDAVTQTRLGVDVRWTRRLQTMLGPAFDVIEAGLNGRTTCLDDPLGSANATYSCNGRTALPVVLHTHKPIDAVILSLGGNDLQDRFRMTAPLIRDALRNLMLDMRRHTVTRAEQPLQIILCSPIRLELTPIARDWGFSETSAATALALPPLLAALAGEMKVLYLDCLALFEPDPYDGVHFRVEDHDAIASQLVNKIATIPNAPPPLFMSPASKDTPTKLDH